MTAFSVCCHYIIYHQYLQANRPLAVGMQLNLVSKTIDFSLQLESKKSFVYAKGHSFRYFGRATTPKTTEDKVLGRNRTKWL